MQLWIGQRIEAEFTSIVSQHNKSELQPGGNKQVSNNLISVIRFNMGDRASQLIGHVKNKKAHFKRTILAENQRTN